MQFGLSLLKQGVITSEQFVDALKLQLASRPQLGAIAIEFEKLSVREVFSILREQAKEAETKQRFGELAVESRLLDEEELASLLYFQSVRVRPMEEIFVEQGILSVETAGQYWRSYRRSSHHGQRARELAC